MSATILHIGIGVLIGLCIGLGLAFRYWPTEPGEFDHPRMRRP